MGTVALRVATRPTHPGDMAVLEQIDIAADRTVGFRYHGSMPSAAERRTRMWEGVLCQHLITALPDGRPIGYATAYQADLRNGHAWIAVVAAPEAQRGGLGLMGLGVFLTHLFEEWPLRIVYAESAAPNLAQFESIIREGTATVEGHLRGATLRPDGSTEDTFWLAITRATWEERWGRLIRRRVTLAAQGRSAHPLQVPTLDPALGAPVGAAPTPVP